MQEKRLQRAKLFSIVMNRAVMRQNGNVTLPHQFAGAGDNRHLVAETLHGLEHVTGDEHGASLLGKPPEPLLQQRDTRWIDTLEGLVEKEHFGRMNHRRRK